MASMGEWSSRLTTYKGQGIGEGPLEPHLAVYTEPGPKDNS